MPIELKVPSVGESITEVQIGEWLKNEGDPVSKDEPVVLVETDKANVEIPAPESGVLMSISRQVGDVVPVGAVIGEIETDGTVAANDDSGRKSSGSSSTDLKDSTDSDGGAADESGQEDATVMPAAARILEQNGIEASSVRGTGPGGRILKEDAQAAVDRKKSGQQDAGAKTKSPEPKPVTAASGATSGDQSKSPSGSREEKVVPMSPLRKSIARSLVEAQQQGALLTTFNEVDMSAVMDLRNRFKDDFLKQYGVKLGFMSFFIKACIDALKQYPGLNAEIQGNSIVYKNYYDVGVAVGGGKGLVVPVIRDANYLSFAELEKTIGDLAKKARDNRLTLEELQGGTFTITNGGIYGSMLSTPIINPPQSGILGMHNITQRPVAVNGEVVIRPMMYVALTYDHRIVDGREAVSFLVRIKQAIEDPSRLLIEI